MHRTWHFPGGDHGQGVLGRLLSQDLRPCGTGCDEQPTDRRVEPALDQIVDQRLDHSGIFGRPLDQAERMLIAAAVDAERGDQHQVVANIQAIDLHFIQLEA
jgi:hypothetical protein